MTCWGYITSDIDKRMSVQHGWNHTDGEKPKHSETTLPHCNFVHLTSHSRLHPVGEIVAVYRGNHRKHMNSACGQNAEFAISNQVTRTAPTGAHQLYDTRVMCTLGWKATRERNNISFLVVSDFEITKVFITLSSASCVWSRNFLRIFTPVPVATVQTHTQRKDRFAITEMKRGSNDR